MKRLHVHVCVNEIAESVRFYSTLFGADPTVTKTDYAKWMLDDPRVNFAISTGGHDRRGVEHLGIQVENEGELAEVYGRLAQADRPVLEEGATVCCYAKSEKSWIADPQGVVWETFHTTGEAVTYGASPELEKLASDKAAAGACCAPVLAEKPAATGCCG